MLKTESNEKSSWQDLYFIPVGILSKSGWTGKSVMTEATKATVQTPYKSVMTYTQWQSPVADLDPWPPGYQSGINHQVKVSDWFQIDQNHWLNQSW